MILKKQLPIGISTFNEIINNDFLYIDKTELIHRLITTNRRCFLSRPRRFGKSLLVSTMYEIFTGNKELFKNLWLGNHSKDAPWTQRPVIYIDFSKLNSESLETLKNDLNNTLDTIATKHGTDASHRPFPREKIAYITETVSTQAKVAILIDEYDAPLLKHIATPETATEIRDFLSGFYTTIKALDPYIYFTFFTGVTKFSKTSLFSGANNLDDISLSEEFATICGYTEEEVVTNFNDWIADCAKIKKSSPPEIINEMRTWYNGYQCQITLLIKYIILTRYFSI